MLFGSEASRQVGEDWGPLNGPNGDANVCFFLGVECWMAVFLVDGSRGTIAAIPFDGKLHVVRRVAAMCVRGCRLRNVPDMAFGNHRDLNNGSSFTYEVIVVDDGSTDGTAAEVYRWVERLGTDVVRLLSLKENQGKGAAVGKVCTQQYSSSGLSTSPLDSPMALTILDMGAL